MSENTYLIPEKEYSQSANALFHFMKKESYLQQALTAKALFPRYYKEDIDYLGITVEGKVVRRVSVLQLCFCDIPLHQLFSSCDINSVEKDEMPQEMQEALKDNTHPGFYGEFAIAFPKSWCEQHNMQPVHYVNPASSVTKEYKKAFEAVYTQDDISDEIVDDTINRITFLKPLKGTMPRIIDERSITVIKNFHDEREWRYIPSSDNLIKKRLERIIYKDHIQNDLNAINERITAPAYREIALSFNYGDIKYLIVPTLKERDNLISFIKSFPKKAFKNENAEERERLISKITVLEELRGDL